MSITSLSSGSGSPTGSRFGLPDSDSIGYLERKTLSGLFDPLQEEGQWRKSSIHPPQIIYIYAHDSGGQPTSKG
jgi:hypothetical protein